MAELLKVTLDTPMSTSQEPAADVSALNRDQIRAMRRSYGEAGLSEVDLPSDPLVLFRRWLGEAAANPVIVEANAMVLSTVDEMGPASRTVLLKDVSNEGFSFFTNYDSNKGRAIAANPRVSLLFPWYAMERQVIVRGGAVKVSAEASADYFAARPWSSQIGAWASSQSQDLESREHLQARFDELAAKYPEGTTVPTPSHWGGYLVAPTSVEFWQGRYSRLHDRLIFNALGEGWKVSRLHP
jgi:pyridoxamine 5'-phosphate oxidase